MSEAPPTFTVLLDANVLAKPLTRTLVMLAGRASGYAATWSQYVEDEANRHQRPRQRSVTDVRAYAKQELSATGEIGGRFAATDPADRQVLADAVEAGAWFVITEDADDFAASDLVQVGVAVVNHDLFLSVRATNEGYVRAVEFIAGRSRDPRMTTEELHARLERAHPLTTAAHATAFASVALPATDSPPKVAYRGNRCLGCLRVQEGVNSKGICPDCRATTGA